MNDGTLLKAAGELEDRVLAELEWDPSVDATDIGVIVEGGVVTLTGAVGSWAEKLAAERAAQRILGVKGVANVLLVRRPVRGEIEDGDIARAAWDAVHANVLVPCNCVRITVEHGRVTLRGELEWHFQKVAAEGAVANLAGVTHVANEITLRPRRAPADPAAAIAGALQRHAAVDASRIAIEAEADKVTLRGAVGSVAEKCAAEDVAWSAPGVAHVVNELEVDGERRRPLPDLVCLP